MYEEVTDEDKYKSMKTDDLIKVADLLKDWARYDLEIHQFLAKERDRAESYRYLANEYKKEANSLTKPLRDERLVNYKYLMEYSNNAEKEAERIEAERIKTLRAEEHSGEGGGYKKRKSNRKRPSKRPHNHNRKHKWSLKYKRSIDCKHPKGFSQRQHCKYGRKNMRKLTRKK